MKCPKCDKTWPTGVKFCGACGAKMHTQPQRHPKEDEAMGQLRKLLPQIGLGEFKEPKPGVFLAQKGSTHVEVRVLPLRPGVVAIRSRSPVTIGTPITQELLTFLMKENTTFLFGAFGLGSGGEIMFSHSIMASSLDAQELGSSVTAVVNIADKYDDQIVQRWGGKTARQLAMSEIVAPALLKAILASANRTGEKTLPERRPSPRAPSHRSASGDEAIKVGSVLEEYLYVDNLRCDCGGSYKREAQVLVERNEKYYDCLRASCSNCGMTRAFVFDINSFFRKN